jgi:hypothetical protein
MYMYMYMLCGGLWCTTRLAAKMIACDAEMAESLVPGGSARGGRGPWCLIVLYGRMHPVLRHGLHSGLRFYTQDTTLQLSCHVCGKYQKSPTAKRIWKPNPAPLALPDSSSSLDGAYTTTLKSKRRATVRVAERLCSSRQASKLLRS